MPASPSPNRRWGLRLSLLAGGAAVVLSLQPHLLSRGVGVFSQPSSSSSTATGESPDGAPHVQTYCYQAVRTSAAAGPDDVDCFSVSSREGVFTRVFSSSRGETPDRRLPSSDDGDADVEAGYVVDGEGVGEGGGSGSGNGNGNGGRREIRRRGYVLPGLWDGHGHLLQYGEFLHSADLFGAGSPAEVRRRLRAYLAENRDANPGLGGSGEWVRGVGWDQMIMGGMPFAVGDSFFFSFFSPLFCLGFGLVWSGPVWLVCLCGSEPGERGLLICASRICSRRTTS